MYLENLVIDAQDPQRLGHFWRDALGGATLTDEPDIFEMTVGPEGGPTLDLCFQPVTDPPAHGPRLHLDIRGGVERDATVERLLGLGATHLDIGQDVGADGVPWVVLADPEGNPLCVMPDSPPFAGAGPIVGLPLDSADRERDTAFWSWLTGWPEVEAGSCWLRHPSGGGPYLGLCPEEAPKGPLKNRLHLDVRLEAGDPTPDEMEAAVLAHGGTRFHPGWGDLPWRSYLDPSGNEFCVLPSRG